MTAVIDCATSGETSATAAAAAVATVLPIFLASSLVSKLLQLLNSSTTLHVFGRGSMVAITYFK